MSRPEMQTAQQFQIVRGIEQMAGLREGWLALEGAAGRPDFFQCFCWSMHVAEIRSRLSPDRYEPIVAVAREQERIVALWPLSRQRRSGQWQLRNLDDPFGQFAIILAAEPAVGLALVAHALAHLKAEGAADSACFERVIGDDCLAHALLSAGAHTSGVVAAPYVELSNFPSIEALKQSRNKKSMKNLRNAIHRMERAGKVESTTTQDPAAVLAIGSEGIANRARWLEATGNATPAFRLPGNEEILIGADRWGLSAKRIAFELRIGGKSAAQQFGFVHAGRYYAYLSGMDWSFEDLAPGRVHLAMVIEAALAAGLSGVEMLTPASDYKMMWTDQVRTLSNLSLSLTVAGLVKQSIWDDGIRRILKLIYYALPLRLRRIVQGRLQRRSEDATAG